MNILLINLPRYKSIPVTRERRCELITKFRLDTPTTLLTIASYLRNAGHRIRFIDANALDLSYEMVSKEIAISNLDVVIFPFCSFLLDHDMEITKIVKAINPSIITIGYSWYGGYFAEKILNSYKYLDIMISGEVLGVMPDLIECLDENGDLKRVNGISYWKDSKIIENKEECQIINFDEYPIPAYDLIDNFKKYYIFTTRISPYVLINSGIGCPFRCIYCKMGGKKYDYRSVDNIMNELNILKDYGVKYIWFYDETFTVKRNRLIDLCNNMIDDDIKIKWFCDSRTELVDEELLKIMRKAGCTGISYGVESGSQIILNNMKKGNRVEHAEKALYWTRKNHIFTSFNLILGFIGENEETLNQTKKFIKNNMPDRIEWHECFVYPQTELAKIAVDLRLIDEEIFDSQWKEHIFGQALKSNLDIPKISKNMNNMLFHNPKWWMNLAYNLMANPEIFLALINYESCTHITELAS